MLATTPAPAFADTRDKIERYGWTVIGVGPTHPDQGVAFAYTVGLSEWWSPELAVYGLDLSTAQSLLNVAARWVTGRGALTDVDSRVSFPGGWPAMALIDMNDTSDLVGVGHEYGEVAAARQIVWPDRDDRMPWQPGYCIRAAAQPLFGRPPRP